jgi:hypothetical protein
MTKMMSGKLLEDLGPISQGRAVVETGLHDQMEKARLPIEIAYLRLKSPRLALRGFRVHRESEHQHSR